MASILKSSKDKPMLRLDDFLYFLHSENKSKTRTYWRCTERDKCNARCTTASDDITQVFANGKEKHTHPPNKPELEAREAVQRIKRRAETHPNEPPAAIIAGEIRHEHGEEVLYNLPERQNLRRAVNRYQNRTRPSNPGNLGELEVRAPYTQTLKGEKILFYHSGRGNEDTVLIFTTKDILKKLCDSSTIFSDGTFQTAPDMFLQLFTVHGIYRQHLFPFVYALTVNKSEATYDILFGALKSLAQDEGLTLHPSTAMSDFELANMNAVRTHFPGVIVKGCLFHFAQSIWGNAVSNGLQTSYKEDEVIREQILHIFGLPFLPQEDVKEVFDGLIEDENLSEPVLRLYETVDTTYVNGRRARGRRRAIAYRRGTQSKCGTCTMLLFLTNIELITWWRGSTTNFKDRSR